MLGSDEKNTQILFSKTSVIQKEQAVMVDGMTDQAGIAKSRQEGRMIHCYRLSVPIISGCD